MADERDRDDFEDELEDEEEQPEESASWFDALEEQFGSAPWWVISTVVHVIVLALMSLIIVARYKPDTTDVIIPMDLADQAELMDDPEPVRDDYFQSDRNIDDEVIVEHPVFVHEEVEEIDHMETENNMDNNTARGQEDAISDIPLGGTGVVGSLGVVGGGAGCYGFRDGGGRKRAALKGGGSRISEDAVDAALRWLYRHQEADGRWDGEKYEGANTDPGITGLALLAFLGAGHTETNGKYMGTVKKAVNWLITHQAADGTWGQGYESGLGYHHSIAGLALAEAYGMAKQPRTGQAAQKAVDYSCNVHQVEYSGWRYNAKQSPDTSVTGWFVMQLKSAKIAGLQVPGTGFSGALAWVDKVTKPGAFPGLVAYQEDRSPTHTMTAVGMLCRQFIGAQHDDPNLIGGASFLLQALPAWEDCNFYYWYYGTLVMFQMGGDYWKSWNANMRDMLVERQRKGPESIDGSWDPDGAWCGQGGRVFSTAMGCLCLEVYYRYLPMYK